MGELKMNDIEMSSTSYKGSRYAALAGVDSSSDGEEMEHFVLPTSLHLKGAKNNQRLFIYYFVYTFPLLL